MFHTEQLRIAIIGGGIGGLCLAIALRDNPHVQVDVYEAWKEFGTLGAGIAFGPNALNALDLIGPHMTEAYNRHACGNAWPEYDHTWMRVLFGVGERAGDIISDIPMSRKMIFLHRSQLLDDLVQLVPDGTAHFNKRLVSIEDEPGSDVTLHFKDGSTATADLVFGADGIHSTSRPHILGQDHPAVKPFYSGGVAYRMLPSMADMISAIGEERALNSSAYVGDGALILTYPVDSGKRVNVVALDMRADCWDGPAVRETSADKVLSRFQGWLPQCQRLLDLFKTQEDIKENMVWELPPAPTYVRGRVAMFGDAAHAGTPFQGQGAGQAIEDAFVLANLLREATSEGNGGLLPRVLEAYDAARRPRAIKCVDTSRECGTLFALRLPGVGENAAAFKANVDHRMDWIWEADMAEQARNAIDVLHSLAGYDHPQL